MKLNNTHFNLLASYAYLGKNAAFCDQFFSMHRSGYANVMIDSGAFTVRNAKEKRDWLTLDTYCDFLGQYGDMCEKYIMLDVIGDDEASKRNYEEMVRRGLAPMFVLTMLDRDFSFVRDSMEVNRHCCVAGGVSTKGPWLIKRFQDTMKATSGKAKIHALGYVTFPNLFRAPIVSGDSSSWVQQAQMYGQLTAFTDKGLKQQTYKEVWGGKKLIPEIKNFLNELGVTPAQFVQKKYHRGTCSIGSLMSLVSYIKYQKYSQKQNRQLFLAVSSKTNLDTLSWVNDNLRDISYEKFCREFRTTDGK